MPFVDGSEVKMNKKINKRLIYHHCRATGTVFLIAALYLGLLPNIPSNIVLADHGDFELSVGIYRIPYSNGTDLVVTQDHHTHGGADGLKDKYDLKAGINKEVVAAASGWIRAIVDQHGNSPNPGDGRDSNGNLHDNTKDSDNDLYNDSLEHSCANPVPPLANCVDYNNYVWIEHPNGEWSSYVHLGTGTVRALGWTADPDNRDVDAANWINAGEVLGLEGDVGFASGGGTAPGNHLHWEIARPADGKDKVEFAVKGGFMIPSDGDGINIAPVICNIVGNNSLLDQNETFTAGPCPNQLPTAEAGGPYEVNEGSTVQLNGTGSTDPDGNPLTYMWSPDSNLNDNSLPQPTFTGVDDSVNQIRLDVFDKIEQANASDATTITVKNVAPTVNAVGTTINEGATATVRASVNDPGTSDTHSVTINWDDGSAVQTVTVAQLAAGVGHVYGDNGTFNVLVTVIDDDGGSGSDTAVVTVANLDPTLSLDTSGEISFPGGNYLVIAAGTALPSSATGTDAGSDDLTFTWSAGNANIFYNNGTSPDPVKSPFGTFPFTASHSIDALYGAPGVETLSLTLTDDDGGSDVSSAGVIVTGNATQTEGSGWWKHQYSGVGAPHISEATALGYLEIVNAVSSVFSETTSTAILAQVHLVLSPTEGDRRARARAELMVAWLQFASGAVDHDATVPLDNGPTDFLVLMFAAEAVINNPVSTDTQLQATELDLAKVRHAF
jgi:hypothetical protein